MLGIDPGTSATGFGLIVTEGKRLVLVEAGVFRSRPGSPLPSRIRRLCDQLERLLERLTPDEVALESLFVARNIRSALTMAHARGAFLLTLARRDLEVAEYAPREVKKAVTGYGAAGKDQVRRMVGQLIGDPGLSVPLDASDALAVAICHAHSVGGARVRKRAPPRTGPTPGGRPAAP